MWTLFIVESKIITCLVILNAFCIFKNLSFLQVFDSDGNGFISREELAKVMRSIGEELSEEDLTEMITEADKNGDGVIDFQEFTQMLSRNDSMSPIEASV